MTDDKLIKNLEKQVEELQKENKRLIAEANEERGKRLEADRNAIVKVNNDINNIASAATVFVVAALFVKWWMD